MKVIVKRRVVTTEVAVLDLPDASPIATDGAPGGHGPGGCILDDRLRLTDPSALPAALVWSDAEAVGDPDGWEDGTQYAIRVPDHATAVALFDRLAEEFRPNHWRLTITPPMGRNTGHGAVVLPEGARWLSATQAIGDGNSQVYDHSFHDSVEDAKARALSLFLYQTQRL